jgi:Protein of unknown function (DUF3105)
MAPTAPPSTADPAAATATGDRRSPGSLLRSRGLWLALTAGAFVACLAVTTAGRDAAPAAGVPPGTQTFPEPHRNHVLGTVVYDRTPPAGGPHNPIWLNCGVYAQPVTDVNAVHSLEHGAVWITYLPSLPPAAVSTLRHLVESHYAGHDRFVILSPYPGQPAPVMATAWGNQLAVGSASDSRLAEFIDHFRLGPQTPEHGVPCSGGVGRPIG